MKVDEFIKGVRPECPVPPHFKHTWVQGMHVKKSYCLYCKKKLGVA